MSCRNGFQLVDKGWASCGRHSFQLKISAVVVSHNQILLILKHEKIGRNILPWTFGQLRCAIMGSLGLDLWCSVQAGQFETMSSI